MNNANIMFNDSGNIAITVEGKEGAKVWLTSPNCYSRVYVQYWSEASGDWIEAVAPFQKDIATALAWTCGFLGLDK